MPVTVFPSLSLFLSTATPPLLFCSFFFVSFFLFFSSTAQHVRVVRDSAGLFQSCVRSFSVLRCCCPPPRKFRTPAKPTVKPIPLAKHRQIAKETQRLLVAMKIRRPPRTFYKGLVVQPQGTLVVVCGFVRPMSRALCSSMFGTVGGAAHRHKQTTAILTRCCTPH